jgi:hypothetical protein
MGHAARANRSKKAMTRRLDFNGDADPDQRRYRLLVDAVVMGGTLANQDGRTKGTMEAIRSQARLLRALKPLSGPDEDQERQHADAGNRAHIPIVSRVLAGGIHIAILNQQEVDTVKDYLPRIPWHGSLSDEISDLYDWLSALPEDKKDDVPT